MTTFAVMCIIALCIATPMVVVCENHVTKHGVRLCHGYTQYEWMVMTMIMVVLCVVGVWAMRTAVHGDGGCGDVGTQVNELRMDGHVVDYRHGAWYVDGVVVVSGVDESDHVCL